MRWAKSARCMAFGLAATMALGHSAVAQAQVKTATFTLATTTACPMCATVDLTGLAMSAPAVLYPNGWTVTTGANGLYVANRTGVTFTVPGHSFDLNGLRLFAASLNASSTGPLTYQLYAFHPGSAIAVVVPLTVNARVVRDIPLSDTRLTNLTSLYVSYDPMMSYTYFIQMRFTSH